MYFIIKHGRHLPDDEAMEIEQMHCIQNNISRFHQAGSFDGATNFQFQDILGIRALHIINVGEKFYWD